MSDKNLLVIGYGNMGRPIVERAQLIDFKPHLVLRKGSNKIEVAQSENINYSVDSIPQMSFQYILLGIKPQNLDDINGYADEILKNAENNNAVIISMLAGVTIMRLHELFPKNPVVRIMPNLGVSIGKSFTLAIQDSLNSSQLFEIKQFLSALGSYEFTENEEWLNTIIPISGSGMGYAAYFILQIINAGITLGLPDKLTRDAILKTVEATIELCKLDDADISELVKRVCSKGGTTEAGIKSLEENEFGDIILNCVKTTFHKAKELSSFTNSKSKK